MDEKLSPYVPRFIPKPCGFKNIGANCHFNTFIQCIMSSPNMNIRIFKFFKGVEKYKDNAVLQEYISVLHKCLTDCSADNTVGIMQKMNASLIESKLGGGMGSNEDAQEDFIKFITSIKLPEFEDIFTIRYEIITKCDKCGGEKSEDYKNLYAELMENVSDYDKYFTNRIERLENAQYNCTGCGKKVDKITRQYILRRVNEVFCVNIAKYINGLNVNLPSTLKLGNHTFKLMATAEHTGGHYYAVCLRGETEQPHRLDDSGVQPCDKINTTPQTYLAFYSWVSNT
jgi:ubiquitin C-terminal hydrolase